MKQYTNDEIVQNRMNAQCVLVGGALFLLGTTAIIVANTAPSVSSSITNFLSNVLRISNEIPIRS